MTVPRRLGLILLLACCVTAVTGVSRQYHFVNDVKTWAEAQRYCRENYTDLATIDNIEDNAKLTTTRSGFSGKAWIGLYDDLTSWQWSISDPSFYGEGETEFRKWVPVTEPNDSGGREHCVNLYSKSHSHTGKWNDLPCTHKAPFVCYDGGRNRNRYVFVQTPKTWIDAQRYCRENHTDLASVRNETENQAIVDLVGRSTPYFLVGLSRTKVWSDGSSSSFRFWASGQPRRAWATCTSVSFSQSAKWTDEQCGSRLPFFCYSVSGSAKPTPELMCGRSLMEVGLPLAQLEAAGLDPSSAHLVDHRCSPTENRNTTMWYGVERTEGTCGNTLTTNGSYAIYSNTLFIYTVNNQTLAPPLSIPFSCYYPMETEASLDVVIRPFLDRSGPRPGHLSGFGPRARASMHLFRNANYTAPYPAGPVSLRLGSVLYVGVSVEEIEKSRFVAVLENCYATHTPNAQDPMRYFLIQNKCPTDRRQVMVSESGSSLKARFSALLFLFQGNYRDVFLHCSLSLCDKKSSSCSPECSRRRPRSTSGSLHLKPLTIGPITWDQTLE